MSRVVVFPPLTARSIASVWRPVGKPPHMCVRLPDNWKCLANQLLPIVSALKVHLSVKYHCFLASQTTTANMRMNNVASCNCMGPASAASTTAHI